MPWASTRPSCVAHLCVAGEEGGDVAEVGGALQRRGLGLDAAGSSPAALELVEQPLEGAGEAGPAGGAAQRPELAAPRSDRRPRSPAAAGPGQLGAGGAPAAVATVRKRPPKVITEPPSSAPSSQSSRSKRVDVVDGGDDEQRVALEHGAQARAGRGPRGPSSGARGSDSAASLQHSGPARGACGTPQTRRSAAPFWRLPPPLDGAADDTLLRRSS